MSTITTINSTDQVSASRSVINTNFSNLNTDKVEGQAASVDSEMALFSGTGGKTIKRASTSGIVKLTSGVVSVITAPSGAIVGDTDTQTLTNKTITAPVIKSWDGWQSVTDSWTYASATTITVPTGAASLYQKGDKIKLTQTTEKYFYIMAVADTLLTVTGGLDYTVANAAITSPYYSHQDNPVGFPSWFNFTHGATWNGTPPTTPTTRAKFCITGKTCMFSFKQSNTGAGTTNTQLSMTPPVTPANATATEYNTPFYGAASSAIPGTTPTTTATSYMYDTSTIYLFFSSISARCAWISGSYEI